MRGYSIYYMVIEFPRWVKRGENDNDERTNKWKNHIKIPQT